MLINYVVFRIICNDRKKKKTCKGCAGASNEICCYSFLALLRQLPDSIDFCAFFVFFLARDF